MSQHPLVSVVVPVFNGLPYLPQTVASVLDQDYPNLELVLVDGGSTDDSLQWLRQQTDPRVTCHALPSRTPAATTWTVACERARGEFVKMMGQDDLLRPDALTAQVAALQAHPDAGLATGLRDIIAADGSVIFHGRGLIGLREGCNAGAEVLRQTYLAGTNIIGEPFAVLFRRAALVPALPWSDTRPLLLDLDLYTTVLSTWDLAVQRRTIGSFRVSATSWSTRIASSQSAQLRAWQREYEADHPDLTRRRRITAVLNVRRNTMLRRAAYLWLRLRRGLHPASG
jgi:glycosyltransferase involved in cell wall biosynthesis